ncbi:MAG TPA: DUF1569 domain-containing protein [Terriglobales bacterium]|nr:DUF1569 domain-containing protein [Terriglobales bacterium]
MNSRLRQLQEALASSIEGMSPEEMSRSLKGKWSVAQVLEHLYLTYSGTVKGCERCLEMGKPLADSPTLRQRIKVMVTVRLGYMPGGQTAPERSRPKGLPPEKVLAEIGTRMATMDELLGQCEARYGQRTNLMNHPILGPLTGRQWRKFHWVHGCHHLKQIRALRRRLDAE